MKWLILLMVVYQTNGLKILGVFPSGVKSHWIVANSMMQALAEAQHDVTVISHFPLPKPIPRYTHIDVNDINVQSDKSPAETNFFEKIQTTSTLKYLIDVAKIFSTKTEQVLNHTNTQRLLKGFHKFDAIIVEVFFSEVLLALGHHFNAPVIIFSSFGSHLWTDQLVGNPAPSSIVPFAGQGFDNDPLTFFQRLKNYFLNFNEYLLTRTFHHPLQIALYKKYFPKHPQPYKRMIRNVSLTFLNSHPIISRPKPYLPNIITIGGVHVDQDPTVSLPQTLNEVVSKANDGVIYFSMGSVCKCSHLPSHLIEVFVKSFRKLKQTVIWVCDEPSVIKIRPKNVFLVEWAPQQLLLSNPKVIAFVTHGGSLSVTEALFYGKPMIGIPVFGDQHYNMANTRLGGWTLRLDHSTLTVSELDEALDQIINNSTFTDNARRLSTAFRDQPMTPKESVVYWTEYIVKHRGATFLQSKASQLNYIEYHNIDIIVCLALVFFGIIKLIVFACRCCMHPRNTRRYQQTQKIKTN